MTETQLILDAIRKGMPERRRKSIMKEIEPDPTCFGKDSIWKIAEKISKHEKAKTKRKAKSLNQWSNYDFVKYLNEVIGLHGLHLERLSIKDTDAMAGLHDKLLLSLSSGQVMSSSLLKEYIDWWVSSYARTISGKIYVATLANLNLIQRFMQRYNASKDFVDRSIHEDDIEEIDDCQIYKMGGLPLLLMSKGIVSSYDVIKDNENALSCISESLRSLSREVLTEVMETTLRLSPYSKELKVDFISIARPALEFCGIKKYQKFSYKEHFSN